MEVLTAVVLTNVLAIIGAINSRDTRVGPVVIGITVSLTLAVVASIATAGLLRAQRRSGTADVLTRLQAHGRAQLDVTTTAIRETEVAR